MNRIAFASLAALSISATPAHAVTNENGQVLITQAAALAGNVTPGDAPGFPVTITVGGSYRLASNLAVGTVVNGIDARANQVTIDLGGFTISGGGVGRNGITSQNRGLTVQNGAVRGFTNDGVRSSAQFLTIIDMVISGNGRQGVYADPGIQPSSAVAFASITSSKVTGNLGVGVILCDDSRVENSIVSRNSYSGIIFYGSGGLVLGSVITKNNSTGIVFSSAGGAGNNTIMGNSPQINGAYFPLQPNACDPACPPPP